MFTAMPITFSDTSAQNGVLAIYLLRSLTKNDLQVWTKGTAG